MKNYTIKSKDERLNRRISKFRREQIHFQYLLEKGHHPVDIADQLNHNMFCSMRIGLENKYPDASNEEIDAKLKLLIENNHKLKKGRRR